MTALLKRLQTQVTRLQVRLYACHARLQAQTDEEALHDLRIALRKLRSLLRPLRREPLCAQLEQAAAALGALSGPLRDLEVLSAELRTRGLPAQSRRRQQQLPAGYQQLLGSVDWQRLLMLIDDWPADSRAAFTSGDWRVTGRRIRKYLRIQQRQLGRALVDPAHDRHRLRLLIKRLRYGCETYPRYSELPAPALHALRRAQAALGDWHDHLQWLARVPVETDLAPCADIWQQRLQQAEVEADQALLELQVYCPNESTED